MDHHMAARIIRMLVMSVADEHRAADDNSCLFPGATADEQIVAVLQRWSH